MSVACLRRRLSGSASRQGHPAAAWCQYVFKFAVWSFRVSIVEGVETNWVKPPKAITGLDHLGTQAPCISLYAQLLPGITNVTDRARYFSFYPWVVWSFDRRTKDRSPEAFTRFLRRADCLFTMIGIRHRTKLEAPFEQHDVALVGSRKLTPAVIELAQGGPPVDLDRFATLGDKTSDRYFGSQWGGMGQYYFGALAGFGLVGMVEGHPKGPPGFGHVHGKDMAERFDAGVDAGAFFSVLDKGTITLDDLDALVSFCPCQLRESSRELALLRGIFLGHVKHEGDADPASRRHSFALLLDAARLSNPQKLEDALRAGAYTRHLPAGRPWELPEHLAMMRDRWGVYQTNELLSLALQALFWAILQAIDIERGRKIDHARAGGDILLDLAERSMDPALMGGTVADAVKAVRQHLPDLGAWDSDQHEAPRTIALERLANAKNATPDHLADVVREALSVLLALLARGAGGSDAYGAFDFEPDRFGGADIDLVALGQRTSTWFSLPMREWIRWLGVEWCVQRHLRVALRKLRIERRDTFRLRPLDGDLRLVAIPPAVFTGPRVARAEQILMDLGLLERQDNGLVPTQAGLEVLEACRAG
jgi:hypothetical protein